jgi:flagellar protein FlaG
MSIQNAKLIADGITPSSGFVASKTALPQTPSAEVDLPKIEVKSLAQSASPALLQHAVDEANKVFSQIHSDVKFVIDSESKKVVIKLIEPSSGEVINQYPSDQAVAISNAISQAQLQAAERQVAFKSSNANLLGMFVKQKS